MHGVNALLCLLFGHRREFELPGEVFVRIDRDQDGEMERWLVVDKHAAIFCGRCGQEML